MAVSAMDDESFTVPLSPPVKLRELVRAYVEAARRKNAGVKMRSLVDDLGVSTRTFYRMLHGKFGPNTGTRRE